MHRSIHAGIAVSLLTMLFVQARGEGDEPRIGQPAPDFSALDSKGGSRRLSEYRGKTVVLEWTNADCPYTRKHYSSGNMQGLQKLAQENGVIWLSVISSAPGKQGFVDGPGADALTRTRGAAPSAVLLDPGPVSRKLMPPGVELIVPLNPIWPPL